MEHLFSICIHCLCGIVLYLTISVWFSQPTRPIHFLYFLATSSVKTDHYSYHNISVIITANGCKFRTNDDEISIVLKTKVNVANACLRSVSITWRGVFVEFNIN